MSRLVIEDGVGKADIGDFLMEVSLSELNEEDGSFCIDVVLSGIDDAWYAKANLHPDSIHDLIEGLTLIANHMELKRPKQSLFQYNGEPGRA